MEHGTYERDRSVLAGIFHSESSAEQCVNALERLGFDDADIGVASSVESQQSSMSGDPQLRRKETVRDSGGSHLWSRIRSLFGHGEHYVEQQQLADSLSSVGIPAERAQELNDDLDEGDVLIVVRCRDAAQLQQAEACFRRFGGELTRVGDKGRRRVRATGSSAQPQQRRIELMGEMLRINKERVQTGEVNVRKEVRTEMQNVRVPVQKEEVVIEQRAVEPRAGSSREIGDNQEIRIPVSEERLNVEKQPYVVGEVEVGKRVRQEERNVQQQVRHEEVRVEKQGDVTLDDAREPRTRDRDKDKGAA